MAYTTIAFMMCIPMLALSAHLACAQDPPANEEAAAVTAERSQRMGYQSIGRDGMLSIAPGSPTPTATLTKTATHTLTQTPTRQATNTPTASSTATPSSTPSSTPTVDRTQSPAAPEVYIASSPEVDEALVEVLQGNSVIVELAMRESSGPIESVTWSLNGQPLVPYLRNLWESAVEAPPISGPAPEDHTIGLLAVGPGGMATAEKCLRVFAERDLSRLDIQHVFYIGPDRPLSDDEFPTIGQAIDAANLIADNTVQLRLDAGVYTTQGDLVYHVLPPNAVLTGPNDLGRVNAEDWTPPAHQAVWFRGKLGLYGAAVYDIIFEPHPGPYDKSLVVALRHGTRIANCFFDAIDYDMAVRIMSHISDCEIDHCRFRIPPDRIAIQINTGSSNPTPDYSGIEIRNTLFEKLNPLSEVYIISCLNNSFTLQPGNTIRGDIGIIRSPSGIGAVQDRPLYACQFNAWYDREGNPLESIEAIRSVVEVSDGAGTSQERLTLGAQDEEAFLIGDLEFHVTGFKRSLPTATPTPGTAGDGVSHFNLD